MVITPSRTLEVTEQRTRSVSAELYRELESSAAVQDLIEAGVVSLVRSRANPYAVRAGAYVGQAIVGDGHRLVVREKASGALEHLLHWSVPEEWREVDIPGAVARSHGGPVLETFAERFLTHLSEYLRDGRVKEYQAKQMDMGLPRGRIDVVKTARLRSRAARSRVAFCKPVLTADILPNQLLALALESIDCYYRLDGGFARVLDRARYYAPAFADVGLLGFRDGDWTARAVAFARAFDDARVGGELRRALEYARALLLHLGPWLGDDWEEGPPVSFFLNLQTLFEDAVRQVATDITTERVSKGDALGHALFPELPDHYIVEPDLVIGEAETTLVADCKYKELKGYPDHSDIYQLTVHAAALDCCTAVLIYPGESAEMDLLGTSNLGVKVCWATVRLNALEQDMRELLITFDVPVTPAGLLA